MQRERITEAVKNLIVDRLAVDYSEIKMESDFKHDLGADSLDFVELVMHVEKAFNVTIPDTALVDIETVSELIDWLEANVAGNVLYGT